MSACRPDRDYADSGSVGFDRDTVLFDTLFRNTPSPTQRLTIYNTTGQDLLLDAVRIVEDDENIFELVLNGIPGNAQEDIQLFKDDSLFAFFAMEAEVQNRHEIKQAYLEVQIGEDIYRRLLYAPILNAILIKDSVFTSQTTIPGDTLVVIDGPALVPEGVQLDLEPGTELHFTPRRDSNYNLISQLLVEGRLVARGTQMQPIVFTNNRFGGDWQTTPGQWQGIHFLRTSPGGNIMDWTIVQNASIGVRVDSTDYVPDGAAKLQLSNSLVRHNANYGVLALGYDPNLNQNAPGDPMIAAYNLCIYNSGQTALGILGGGFNIFEHITVGEYGWDISRSQPAFVYTNTLRFDDENGSPTVNTYPGYLKLTNSIVYGSEPNEIGLDVLESNGQPPIFDFRKSIIRAEEETAESLQDFNVQIGNTTNYPKFDSLNAGIFPEPVFDLGSTSPALNSGFALSSDSLYFTPTELGTDLYGIMRDPNTPDLGAFERVD